MPLVFVHGVNVRKGETEQERAKFDEGVRRRDELFRAAGLAGLVPPSGTLHIENPYWGDLGAQFRFDLVSVPAKGAERFGPGEELMARVLEETLPQDAAAALAAAPPAEDTFLLTLARRHSLPVAVDALVTASALDVPDDEEEDSAAPGDELAAFAARAVRFAESNPAPSWLADPATDDEFVERLLHEVQADQPAAATRETFGGIRLPEGLKRAARKLGGVASSAARATVDAARGVVRGAVGAVAGGVAGVVGGAAIVAAPGAVAGAVRPVVTQRIGLFFGDVFAYLANRGPIQQIVIEALRAADRERTVADSRLVVVAHSMGGNIVYDLLTSVLAGKLHIDAFVTVGSQVGLFKELALFTEDAAAGAGAAAAAKVPKPAGVGTWINVFDPIDALGFAAEGVFEGVSDFAFSNETSVLQAHTLYFFRPRFHERLRARLAEAGFGSA